MGNKIGKKRRGKKKKIQILFLGSGESGKSTFFKQIKIIYDGGYSKEEVQHYKRAIYTNIFDTMKVLCKYVIDKGGEFQEPKNLEKAKTFIEIANSESDVMTKYTKRIAVNIVEFWKDKSVRQAFEHRYDYHVFDGAEHFFQQLEKLDPEDYTPSPEDIIRCRRKTTGITKMEFSLNKMSYEIIDVGGQRNERKKWKHIFEGISIVLYVASLADYDQKCYEDDITNRMLESMDCFDEVINGNRFKDSHIMLFMNKVDIFEKKLTGKKDLKKFFPQYEGSTLVDAKKFIENKFRKINKFDDDRLHPFFTQATASGSVTAAFEFTLKVIIQHDIGPI